MGLLVLLEVNTTEVLSRSIAGDILLSSLRRFKLRVNDLLPGSPERKFDSFIFEATILDESK